MPSSSSSSSSPEDASRGLSARAFWDPRTPPNESDSEDEENDPSSIADVFADMLNVNEDMIMAIAECHGDQDIQGTLAYQRILHRNLMEMANYVDSMFGVYGDRRRPKPGGHLTTDDKRNTAEENADSPLAAGEAIESLENELASANSSTNAAILEDTAAEPSALMRTLEADEKRREIKRSNKLWLKSRHQVREEESVSAIMNETAEKIASIAVAARDDAMESARPSSKEKRAPKSFSAEAQDSDSPRSKSQQRQQSDEPDSASAVPPVRTPIAAALLVPTTPFLSPSIPQLGGMGLMPFLTPEALSGFAPNPAALNMLFPSFFPSLPLLSVCKKVKFKRMCEECRKCHWSLSRCRVTLGHTAPEWQPAQNATEAKKQPRKSRKAQNA
uniref:SS18 N-terminal domain-containing protein n=1 Tax=Globisporangium ultimum (strain ATCC 200006 / CBS 805.95 / DAOM BR144) TaxID=431595 RepID=K3X8G9_GLOUD